MTSNLRQVEREIMSEMNDFPAWHPAALGEQEDIPGEGATYASVQAQRDGTAYTGKVPPGHTGADSSSGPSSSPRRSDKYPSDRIYPKKRSPREGYKKGFRKPKPNPKSPFAPAFGASSVEEKPVGKKKTSRPEFRADSRLAETESTLIQGVTGGRKRPNPAEPESEFTKAKNIVLNQLAASAKSRAQLEKKLQDKEISAETAAEVLDRFEAVKLVNDEEFALMYVRTRANVKKLSKTAIRRELKQKGVSGELAENALEQRTEEDERADAQELVRKKLRPSMDFSDRKEKDKIMRRLVSMLARKGYPSSMAFSVVKEEIDLFIEENGIESEASSDDYYF